MTPEKLKKGDEIRIIAPAKSLATQPSFIGEFDRNIESISQHTVK